MNAMFDCDFLGRMAVDPTPDDPAILQGQSFDCLVQIHSVVTADSAGGLKLRFLKLAEPSDNTKMIGETCIGSLVQGDR